MATVKRFDRSSLGKAETTPQGGLRVSAAVTRSGVFVYANPDGTVRREYRPPDEVFRADSLQSLAGAPVTLLHPSEMVSTENFRELSVGHVESPVSQEGPLAVATLRINDQSAIDKITSGEMLEVSAGYTVDLEFQEGVTPEGERYDAVQRSVFYNHLALVPRGRAGRDVRLRLDSDNNQVPEDQEALMSEENKEETPVEEAVETVSREDELQGQLDVVTAERDALKAQTVELQARVDGLDKEITVAVEERLGLLRRAEKVGVEVRADMDSAEINKAILGKLLPGVELEGKSEFYVAAALDILEQKATGNAGEARADALSAREDSDDSVVSEAPDVLARRKMIKGNK